MRLFLCGSLGAYLGNCLVWNSGALLHRAFHKLEKVQYPPCLCQASCQHTVPILCMHTRGLAQTQTMCCCSDTATKSTELWLSLGTLSVALSAGGKPPVVAKATHSLHPSSQNFRKWSVFFSVLFQTVCFKGPGIPSSPLPSTPPPPTHPPNPQPPHPFSTQLWLLAGEFTVTFYVFPSTPPPTTTSIFNSYDFLLESSQWHFMCSPQPHPQPPHPFSTQLWLLAGEFTVTFYVFPSTPPPTTTSIFNPVMTSCWRVHSDILCVPLNPTPNHHIHFQPSYDFLLESSQWHFMCSPQPHPQKPHPFSTQLWLLAGEFTVPFYVFPSTPPSKTTSIFNTATTASCWRVHRDIFVCNSCSGHHTSCNRSGKLGRRDRIRSASLSRKPLLINSKDPNAEVTIFPNREASL